MTMPAWLIPTLRAALRVAVRLLRRYEETYPGQPPVAFDPRHYLHNSVVFSNTELDSATPAQFMALVDARLGNMRDSLALAYAQRTRALRKLTELDIP
jgi:hypothetical protein